MAGLGIAAFRNTIKTGMGIPPAEAFGSKKSMKGDSVEACGNFRAPRSLLGATCRRQERLMSPSRENV